MDASATRPAIPALPQVPRTGRRQVRGFTLIEVMGALLILSVAMMSALRLATASTARLAFVDRSAEAVRLASELGDSVLALPYASLNVGSGEVQLTRGSESWRARALVTQWSPRVRRLQITVQPLADTLAAGSVTFYRVDSW